MDQISENICDFESSLKNRSSKKPLALYTSNEDRNKLLISSKNSKISAKEVLANVSRQVKALQNADTVSYRRVGNTLDKYKNREFMTVNMMPVDGEVHQKQPTKFETQCVSDTQLISVIENAEIVDKHGGVTQEFDKTFCQNSDDDSDDKIYDSSLKPGTKTDTGNAMASGIINNDRNTILKKKYDLHDEDSKLFDNSKVITCEMDTITCYQSDVITDFNDYVNNNQETQGFNKCVEIFDVSEEDADRPVSAVLHTNRKSTASPLVVNLYTFEKFENLAYPIIEEHADFAIAKNMINSQIIGKEILIPAHNYENIGRYSPVFSKIDCITTNFNKDDVESICTCINNCVTKAAKCTNEQGTEDIILTSENKKTQSKVINAELKDEILFSSDDEYEYLHKSIQELPLTCPLETSFYDKPHVLDKTMYVGFQTASNKSIQINTDSFTNAKSMLSDIDKTGCTLSDLVEIFDSGKAVIENEENVKLTSNKLDCDTNIHTSSITEHSHKNLSQPSTKVNEFEEKIGDTLQNVSLTAIEQGREDNDVIVMSQIINFESTLRSTNNSIISDGKVDDTLENVGLTMLEQNKEKDDDIMMSQVLTFKSISRTPHVAASVSHDSQLRKVMAKRKLEGFKTASNKKIKLSDNALARCKKVFQDIDFNDSEYLSSKSNFTDTEEITHEDAKSHDFDISHDASKASWKVDHSTKENYICDNVPNKMISEDDYFKAEVKEQTNNEDIHLQINDQIIIQEFEENEMPLKETNNNAYVGFKTASNKNITISENAMAATKHVFQDIMTIAASNGCTMKTTEDDIDDFGKYENVLRNAAPDLINIAPNHVTYDIQKLPTGEFVGFKTASYKEIIISSLAREHAKDFYRDLDEEPTQNVNKDGAVNSNIVNKNINNVADEFNCGIDTQDFLAEELTHIEELFKGNTVENIKPASPTFKGFQTASRKAKVISEKALEKSKKLFEDITNKECDLKCLSTKENEQEHAHGNKMKIIDKIGHIEKDNDMIFKGFQTASNKKVAISEKALAKSKEFFEDIYLSEIEQEPTINKIREPVVDQEYKHFGGFQTASNSEVKLSGQVFPKTKDILVEKENDWLLKNGEVKTPDLKANVDIICSKNNKFTPIACKLDIHKDIIDTQVLNDFESTLNTEDFCKSTPVSKRSGSPILSCPRAKKRKFETPYGTSKNDEPRNVRRRFVFVAPKLAKMYNFNEDYKKHKKYTLNDIIKLEKEQTKVDVDPYLSEFDFDSLLNFVFYDKRNDYSNGKMTTEDIKKIFLDSVNKRIVPEGWLENHIKLIIWKLISYELKLPNVMKNTCTVRNVLEQLKYRYDKELYHVQRPILRKILEKDEVPSKTMVLCIAAIYVDNVSVISVPPSSQNVDLLVTDGWYCIKACLDRMLIRLVVNGSIVVGTKIAVCGAELINCEQGVAPWEDTSSVRLKLHGNSTRRARWLARLGPRADLIPCGLRAARADGGRAGVVRLAITRLYPPMTVERMDNGSTVTLSERLENIRQMKYESERQVIMEKLYEEVEKEMFDLDSQDSEGSNEKGCIDSGSQIAKCMKKNKDPDEYRSHLTKSQSRMLEDHNSRQREKLVGRVRERFHEKLDKYGLKTDRNVVQLLKVRVADFTEKAGSVEITKGYLSIWRPSAAVLELVTEGAWIEILNVIPTGMRNSEIQLSTGRQTVFNPYKQKNEKYKLYANTLQRKCYEIKVITQNPTMTTDYNEIDTVGVIFCIDPSTKEFHGQGFQNVYLADADKNIICVNFWGGLKRFGYENLLDTGHVITCVNLQKRAGNTRNSIPQYRVTELSYFTKTPKSKKAMEITNEMTNKLSKIKDKFCEDCIFLKNNYSTFKTRDHENVTPYRFEYNIPKNSPRNCDGNLNLTGLDFESSFDSQEISPQALLQKKKVNEKIEKIRLNYGEPPPLSSIHINKSENASATYKSPLISNVKRSKSPLKMASPVSVYRAFVKNVNPVKLNFSRDLNESIDHIAEDFDASPPLSLD